MSGEGGRFHSSGGSSFPGHCFFQPSSVALVGATERRGSVGRALLENLSTFPGVLHVVHPKRDAVLGHAAVSSLKQLPAQVDLVVLATPARTIPSLMQEAGACGIRAAVVVSAGFKECGQEGVELERIVRDTAVRSGLRVLGPNCLGVMSPARGFNATFSVNMARPGRVAFLSQSGALCTAILDWSFSKKIGFSAFVSVGSMLDVGWGELIRYFGEDAGTECIVVYMESVGNAAAFIEAAREASQRKPLVVIKVGRTQQASRAAASHTGAMTGCDAVLDAAFEQSGVVRVDTIEELFDLAEFLSKQPLPGGPRLAVLTNAGGPAALATDALVGCGGSLAEFSKPTLEALNSLLPPQWSRGNPVDMLGDANAARYEACLGRICEDPNTDGVLVILTPQAMTQPTETAEALVRSVGIAGKPVFASWMGGPTVLNGRAVLDTAGVPNFAYPDEAAKAWQSLWEYRCLRSAALEWRSVLAQPRVDFGEVRAGVVETLGKKSRTLSEWEAKSVLAWAGIPVLETRRAFSEEEAVDVASQIGFPVVLKLLSETITHKSEVGGVQLNLGNAEAVRRGWRDIREAVSGDDFRGVSVQRMYARRGVELICGWSWDTQFGPVLLFGAGGIFAEVFQDRVLMLPPLSSALALERIRRTRIFSAFAGIRGLPKTNVEEILRVLVRLGDLALAMPEIRELDVNPLVATDEGVLALDARMVVEAHPLGGDC